MKDRFDSDQALLSRCEAGEVEACHRLYERYRAGIFDHALRILGDPALAAEALEETVLKVFRTMPNRHPRATLGEILHRTLRENCLPRGRGDGNSGMSANTTPAAGASETNRDPWPSLPAAYREALGLRLDTDLSWTEIAGVLGVPEGTVRSRVHQALEHLSRGAAHGL